MTSDHDPDGYRADCCYCGSLGNYTSQRDAANAELQHQLNKHPVQLQGATGNASTTSSSGKPAKLTRAQKRGKYPKPGKR